MTNNPTLAPVSTTSAKGWAYWLPSLLALLSAGLLWAGWPVHPAPLALLLLVAWVPYLLLEQRLDPAAAPAAGKCGATATSRWCSGTCLPLIG